MDLQKTFENIGTLCTIIGTVSGIIRFLNSKTVLYFFENTQTKLSPWAFKIEENIKKNKGIINFILKTIGIGSFGLCVAGATCAYLLGTKIVVILVFIILGLILRWFYGKLLIIS